VSQIPYDTTGPTLLPLEPTLKALLFMEQEGDRVALFSPLSQQHICRKRTGQVTVQTIGPPVHMSPSLHAPEHWAGAHSTLSHLLLKQAWQGTARMPYLAVTSLWIPWPRLKPQTPATLFHPGQQSPQGQATCPASPSPSTTILRVRQCSGHFLQAVKPT
jgi:hypothetical protein